MVDVCAVTAVVVGGTGDDREPLCDDNDVVGDDNVAIVECGDDSFDELLLLFLLLFKLLLFDVVVVSLLF